MSVSKRRFSVTLTTPYIERLDSIVKEGVDIDQPSAIRTALRLYFEHLGMPLTLKEAYG